MRANVLRTRRAFSLIELVIVVVIIAIIGAIAIPRMSRGAAGAAESALVGDLAVLRSAIDLYQTEHGGAYPTLAGIVAQLTQYSDENGGTNATKTVQYKYGPYLRKVPPLPLGANKGDTAIAGTYGADVGWVYTVGSGHIAAGTNPASEFDEAGTPYSDY